MQHVINILSQTVPLLSVINYYHRLSLYSVLYIIITDGPFIECYILLSQIVPLLTVICYYHRRSLYWVMPLSEPPQSLQIWMMMQQGLPLCGECAAVKLYKSNMCQPFLRKIPIFKSSLCVSCTVKKMAKNILN